MARDNPWWHYQAMSQLEESARYKQQVLEELMQEIQQLRDRQKRLLFGPNAQFRALYGEDNKAINDRINAIYELMRKIKGKY